MTNFPTLDVKPEFQVTYRSLLAAGSGHFTFPCDEKGRVDLDALSEARRRNYFYVRALVGRHYSAGKVERTPE